MQRDQLLSESPLTTGHPLFSYRMCIDGVRIL